MRGATLVDYLLVVAALVLAALGAFALFGDRARAVVGREAECVESLSCTPGSPYAMAGGASGASTPSDPGRFWEGPPHGSAPPGGAPATSAPATEPPPEPGFFESLWAGFTGASTEGSVAATVGDVGGSFIPFYGNGRDAARSWERGEYGWATLYGAGVVGDVFGGSLIKGTAKAGARALSWTGRILGWTKKGKTFYRGAGRAPAEVFEKGFKARGVDGMGRPPPTGSLEDRVRWDQQYPTGEFVNVTADPAIAQHFAKHRSGWIYEIKTSREGIETNKVLGGKSKYPEEQEFKFSEIQPSEIVGAKNLETGEWLANPSYRPD